ncbi:hypothetical protein SAMN05428965_4705, partial [Geodermatophilus sp. DSM 45219]
RRIPASSHSPSSRGQVARRSNNRTPRNKGRTNESTEVKVVQHRLRHGSAKTTLDTYGHLWPDSDESARAAVGAVLAARAGDSLGTGSASPQ